MSKDQNEWVIFYLCPICKRISREWYLTTITSYYNYYTVYPDGDVVFNDSSTSDEEDFYETQCPNCNESFSESAGFFTIKISRKDLTILPVGGYWNRLQEDLERLRNRILDQFLEWREHEHEDES